LYYPGNYKFSKKESMNNEEFPQIYVGDIGIKLPNENIRGAYVTILGDRYYKILHFDAMPPFFMSIVSSSNHWFYISSTGGLSAGRGSAEQALFPYYTVDKLTESSETTGHKAILLVKRGKRTFLWEPFSRWYQGVYRIQRNIYNNVVGTSVIFVEQNHDLGLCFSYAWRTSDAFGFVKTSWLRNMKKSTCRIVLVDGFQNILPANAATSVQNSLSSLLDAYKRNELDDKTGLAIFALNATLTDLAEPSESLLATTVWHTGLDPSGYLLSSTQLDHFRAGKGIITETEVRGQRGAYFVHANLELPPAAERHWHLIADVGQDSTAIVALKKNISENLSALPEILEKDIAANKENLERIVAGSDGLQLTSDTLCSSHHFANVMFNVMRGGIFADQYRVQTQDFIEFLTQHNHLVVKNNPTIFSQLPAEITIWDLQAYAEASDLQDLIRLSYSYLPLMFSRRHGDPSRPWNRFEIDIKKPDGSPKLGYEGNWRDIFQNWEALAYSYPEFVESMICTFLNATTADGYNPYRITRHGIDWEIPNPGNPWANIGYWSDHQIIYLQKLMELSSKVHPGKLRTFLTRPMFSYANIPYRIKPYKDLQKDPYNSIDFDWDLENKIESSVKEWGTDAKLIHSLTRRVIHATLSEKLLTLLLAKMVNFVPEGGIWMNTQRPEWNDANNALVGKGLSVVTLSYLRRTVQYCRELFRKNDIEKVRIRNEVYQLYSKIFQVLNQFQSLLDSSFSDKQRRMMMDELGQSGSDYRWTLYSQGFREEFTELPVADLVAFLDITQRYIDHTLHANKRSDSLYHAYNILHLGNYSASIGHLNEMLEGQVAILSSGLLSGEMSLQLLQSLRNGRLYCRERCSYLLYPDRIPPRFLEKNFIQPTQVSKLRLVSKLVKAGDHTLIIKDVNNNFHFSSSIRNVKDVIRTLEMLSKQPDYTELVIAEGKKIEALFESVFKHAEFTGRSGTFFAYEGLGSIYWHMVSKLLLAVQETILRTRDEITTTALIKEYNDIRMGLSYNRSPDDYGAFPTVPYSHTPKGQGAKQPGMTGAVKEEILTRQGELGYYLADGRIGFDFLLLDKKELLSAPAVLKFWNVIGQQLLIEVPVDSLAFSICQVPVIIQGASKENIVVYKNDGNVQNITNLVLDSETSRHIFTRDGTIHHLMVSCCV
jgi:hypothetical protein